MPLRIRPFSGRGARCAEGWMLGALLLAGCAGTGLTGHRGFNLQEVGGEDGVTVELRYKTSRNITGKPLYRPNFRAYATPETAQAIKQAAGDLREQGYELVLLDAWRPPVAAALLWNAAVAKNLREMYAPPSLTGHSRGTSVDVTLRTVGGGEVDMPGNYDCHISGGGETPHSVLLKRAMRKAGFTGHGREWWHFDHHSSKNSRIVEDPLEKRRWIREGEKGES